jgi:hypothetical protein
MPPGRFDALPDRETVRSMKGVAQSFWDRSTRKEKPDRDDGFADGAGTFLLFRPESWKGVKRVRVTGAWSHQDAPEGEFHYLDATAIDPTLMTEEFFETLAAALRPADARAESGTPFPDRVSDNRRHLIDQRGEPFFYLCDTDWELFHRLDRKEAGSYLKDRADKRFTIIQAVVLAELGGLVEPNPYGHLWLIDHDPKRPVEGYFEHDDAVVQRADELGLVVGMLPT